MNPETFRTRAEGAGDLEKAMSILGTDKLGKLCEQVGITDVIELGPRATRRPAPNIGIHKRVYSEENTAKAQYYACALLINVHLLGQVIFASALTTLGAGHGSDTQITVLGAAKTVISAILTFTKGSGLPNRLRQHQQTLIKVRECIEQRERDFAQSDYKPSVKMEMKTIKQRVTQAPTIA